MKALTKSTEYKYDKALSNYLNTGNDLTDYEALQHYALTISNSAKAHLKAAIKRNTESALLAMKAQATLDNVDLIQVAGYRTEALNQAIIVRQPAGQKIHNWLSRDEVKELMSLTDGPDLVSQRDKIVLALLTHTGLRRNELVSLSFDDISQRDGVYIVTIKGKGGKYRTIPISNELYALIDKWRDRLGHQGLIARSLGMNKEPKGSMSGQSVLNLISKYGQMIGKPELRPHDLRRTFAETLKKQGRSIEEISILLGHDSIDTTKKYLDLQVDLSFVPGNFMPV